MKKTLLSFLICVYFLPLVLPVPTQALDCSTAATSSKRYEGDVMCLNIPIGGLDRVEINKNPLFTYLKIWYGFVIGSVGILTTVMVMWGGFKWLTSRGNSGTIGDAKEIIWGSIIGLFLCLLSYTILELINPKLLEINLGVLGDVSKINQKDTDEDNSLFAVPQNTETAEQILTGWTAQTAAEKSAKWASIASPSLTSMSKTQIQLWSLMDYDQKVSTFAALMGININNVRNEIFRLPDDQAKYIRDVEEAFRYPNGPYGSSVVRNKHQGLIIDYLKRN